MRNSCHCARPMRHLLKCPKPPRRVGARFNRPEIVILHDVGQPKPLLEPQRQHSSRHGVMRENHIRLPLPPVLFQGPSNRPPSDPAGYFRPSIPKPANPLIAVKHPTRVSRFDPLPVMGCRTIAESLRRWSRSQKRRNPACGGNDQHFGTRGLERPRLLQSPHPHRRDRWLREIICHHQDAQRLLPLRGVRRLGFGNILYGHFPLTLSLFVATQFPQVAQGASKSHKINRMRTFY